MILHWRWENSWSAHFALGALAVGRLAIGRLVLAKGSLASFSGVTTVALLGSCVGKSNEVHSVMFVSGKRTPPAPGIEPGPKPDPEPQPGSDPDLLPPITPDPEPDSNPDLIPPVPEPSPI
jgi:hypothetical protein